MNKKNEAEKLQEDMIEIVKSKEAKNVFEEGLKNLDPKALTSEGIIQSYKIDYDSIEHNPMGGIKVTLYVNGDPELYVMTTLNKYDNENIEGGGGGYSGKLNDMLKRGANK